MHEAIRIWLRSISRRRGGIWKQSRMYECARESDQAYTTPQVVESRRQGCDRHVGRRSSHRARCRDRQAAVGKRRLQSGERSALAGDRVGGDRRRRGESCPTAAASFWPACGSAARATSRNRIACGKTRVVVFGADVPTPVDSRREAYFLSDRCRPRSLVSTSQSGDETVVGRTAAKSQQVLRLAGPGRRQALCYPRETALCSSAA